MRTEHTVVSQSGHTKFFLFILLWLSFLFVVLFEYAGKCYANCRVKTKASAWQLTATRRKPSWHFIKPDRTSSHRGIDVLHVSPASIWYLSDCSVVACFTSSAATKQWLDLDLSSPVIVTVPEISIEKVVLPPGIRSDMLLSKTYPRRAQLPPPTWQDKHPKYAKFVSLTVAASCSN